MVVDSCCNDLILEAGTVERLLLVATEKRHHSPMVHLLS